MESVLKRCNEIIYGVRAVEGGTAFCTIIDPFTDGCGIAIYDNNHQLLQRLPITEDLMYGDVCSVVAENLDLRDKRYRFYSKEKEYIDSYTACVVGNDKFGASVKREKLYGTIQNTQMTRSMKKLWEEDRPIKRPYSESIFYLLHVRGFSMCDPASRKSPGTFRAIAGKTDYFTKLGITAIELMPCYEFIEKENKKPMTMASAIHRCTEDIAKGPNENFWGYKEAFYFSPKSSYAFNSNAGDEFKEMILKLHKQGIECIMQFYFPDGYRTDYIIDVLKYWVLEYHIDGFRLLGNQLPMNEIVNHPLFRDRKILADGVDYHRLLGERCIRYKNAAVYSDGFMNDARRFLKSDEDMITAMAYHMRENYRNFSMMHYITNYYGFTLWDLVSYDRKHNEQNGEDGKDGSNYNYSWNCGEEGISKKRNVNLLRQKQIRNAYLMMMLAQGTPVILAGDENLNSAFGNNNAYCQDNEIGWTLWNTGKKEKQFHLFVSNLIAFRKRHTVLHQPTELKLLDYMSCQTPDISYHGEDAWKMNTDSYCREFAFLLGGEYAKQYSGHKEESILVIFNLYWEKRNFALIPNEKGNKWKLLYCTDQSTPETFEEQSAKKIDEEFYQAPERSISILIR